MTIRDEFRPFLDEIGATQTTRGSSLASKALKALQSRHGWEIHNPALQALASGQRSRYVIAPRRFARSAVGADRDDLRLLDQRLRTAVLRSELDGPKVLQLSPLEEAVLRERFAGLTLERDIQHHLPRTPLLRATEPIAVPASSARSLTVRVRSGERAVGGARVVLRPSDHREDGYEGVTNAAGELQLAVRAADSWFARVIVEPRANFWSRVWADVTVSQSMDLEVRPLDIKGFDWGLKETGAAARGAREGHGVKVAIIDSGIGLHPSLNVTGGKNFIVGENADEWFKDEDGHGTHCAGVVAALAREHSTWGYAPGVQLYAARVFGGADGGGYASDIADAIREAVRQGCDLINLSLASQRPSGYLRRHIEDALESGVLCIAAAGNDGGEVAYPAKFPGVTAVSAIGRRAPRPYPDDSIHRGAEDEPGSDDDRRERVYFFPTFSNRGPEIAFCGPGVAITSTLPPHDFAPWDGTSMACPHVTGVAAIVLDTLALPRTPDRSARLLHRLHEISRDLGMERNQQGAGLPQVDRL